MIYKYNFLKVQEIWFDENEKVEKVDKIIYTQIKNKLTNNSTSFTSLIIHLNEDENIIFSKFKKNNKYEINRALNKDTLNFNIFFNKDNIEILDKFVTSYNKFSEERNLKNISFDVFSNYLKNGNLLIANISDMNGNILCWHTYIISNNIIRLKTSNSFFTTENNDMKNLIGRANRLLHWEVIKFSKNKGFSFYDFGGWYEGVEDTKKLNINKFKESFSGEKVITYNDIKYLTLKSRIFKFLSNIKKRIKG